jgi:hypothetical protein
VAHISIARTDILLSIAHSKAGIAAAIADMHETVVRTREVIEQTRKLLLPPPLPGTS